jgi:N-methylhydantoinase A
MRAARTLFLDGRHVAAAIYQREDLAYGETLSGPVIIQQEDTTTVVLPAWSATVDALGNLLIARNKNGG